ncbi:MAG TPA: glycosyltransferase [Chitinophagaceae bacterium]|nr:glycosyltransferase [Chitinophagaceae bacterium]
MPKKIIVGILDWGLGHATRCIPLIDYMLQTECQIFIAASGPQRKILQEAFPSLSFLDPPPYQIQYPPRGKNLVFSIIKQLPRLRKIIKSEHDWLQKAITEYGIDLIISDNRYGFQARGVHSVMITHQLAPKSGMGTLIDRIARIFQYHYINQFDECWVPDLREQGGLAGELSHPNSVPERTIYIGPLSRFSKAKAEGSPKLLVLISGPEPARSEFEELMRAQLQNYHRPYLLVRGLPGSPSIPGPKELNHASTETLGRLLEEASLVICRSGYTTVMDLVRLGKKAVLVPTPGQTEQEYLAQHLQKRNMFPFMLQSAFVLEKAIEMSETFSAAMPTVDFDAFHAALDRVIKQ